MQTPLEVFDEWLTTLGTPNDPNDPPPWRFVPPAEVAPVFELQLDQFKRRLENIEAKVTWKQRILINPNFIDAPSCNAEADVYKSMGMIGLYKGLVLLPIDLFLRMFSHPDFLRSEGNPRNELRSAQHSDGVINDYDALIEKRKRGRRPLHPIAPRDPTRRRLAGVCADIVWRFIAWHEMVHILHGHVGYLNHKYSRRFSAKAARTITVPPLSPEDLDFQAIELWADSYGAMASLRNLLTVPDSAGAYAAITNDRQRLFLWSLSLFTLFRLLGFEIDPLNLRNSNYPPNPVRFALLADGECAD
jgi:hypothetical protein